jgi:serine/threonine-protein kinase
VRPEFAVPGHVLGGRYLVEEIIGQGSFGRVFRAVDIATSTPVALKEFVRESGKTDSFLREVGILFELKHPHVIACESLTMSGRFRYIVCEYMEGGSLRDLLESSRAGLLQMLEILREVAVGVAYAHERNVIHRDLKPENILLTRRGGELHAKVSDFGISTLGTSLGTRSWIGSPAYMAPEQFYDAYDQRVDVYALGVIAFEIICGRRPFRGTPAQLMAAHIRKEPEFPAWLPRMTLRFLRKALAKKPEKRFESVRAFIDALDVVRRVERPALVDEAWPSSVGEILTIAHASDEVLVRTRTALLRLDRRGRVVEELPPVDHALGRELFSLLVTGETATLRGPNGSRVLDALPPGASPALSADGSVAYAVDGGAYVVDTGGRHELKASGSGVTSVEFVGSEHAPCIARSADGQARIEIGGARVDLPQPISKIVAHGSRYELIARSALDPERCFLVRLGEVFETKLDCGDFTTDEQAFYAVSPSGELVGVSVGASRISRTRWEWPLAAVAASAEGFVCGTRDGRVLAVR